MNWIGWLISLASLIVAICALVGVGKEIADRKDEAKKQAAATWRWKAASITRRMARCIAVLVTPETRSIMPYRSWWGCMLKKYRRYEYEER